MDKCKFLKLSDILPQFHILIASTIGFKGRKQEEISTVCNQIKEITGIHDEKVIKRAITACQDENGKFDIENVVAMLVAEDSHVNNSPSKKVTVTYMYIVMQIFHNLIWHFLYESLMIYYAPREREYGR